MRDYVISFDLFGSPPETYSAFFETLDAIGVKQILSNGAFVTTERSAYDLFKLLAPTLRRLDNRLLIIEVVATECASVQLLHPICKEKPL